MKFTVRSAAHGQTRPAPPSRCCPHLANLQIVCGPTRAMDDHVRASALSFDKTPPLTEIDLFKTEALVSRQLAQERAYRHFTPTPHPRVPMNFIPVRYALP